MASFPTYGMAGIGIAAAIGFVFALSILVNTGGIDGGEELASDLSAADQQREAEMTGESTPFANDTQEGMSAPAGESTMMQVDLRPALNSVIALEDGRDIGEVVPGTELAVGEPVLIQASFSNPADAVVSDHFIAMSIRNAGQSESLETGESERAATFRGDIAANGSAELELYWTPQSTGDYTLLVFSATPSDLASTVPIEPVASIPIEVTN